MAAAIGALWIPGFAPGAGGRPPARRPGADELGHAAESFASDVYAVVADEPAERAAVAIATLRTWHHVCWLDYLP